jgi:uncharacterized protein (DUF362 family)
MTGGATSGTPSPRPRVIVRRCDGYDPARVRGIVAESLADLGVPAAGRRVFIKPNVVSANRRYIHDSFTNPAVFEGTVGALRDGSCGRIVVGESGGYGIPGRLFFRESGYAALARRLGVDLVDLNEHPTVRVPLARAAWHQEISLSTHIASAGLKVWMPKLKFHIFCGITNALKLNVGILQHRERMRFHDWRVHEKIVDLLEAGYPDVVVTDAIDVTYGFESAPYPVHLGALLVADHPVACDAVGAWIMGYDPPAIRHLAIASERGYGSIDLADFAITGDVSPDELRDRPKGRPRLFQVLADLDTPIRFVGGVAGGPGAGDAPVHCDGGCEGAVKGCLGTIEKRRPGSLASARPGVIVTGVVTGDVVCPDGPALLVGDCTRVEGRLDAPRVVRVRGCPVPARDLFVKVPLLFRMPSPMLDLRDACLFVWYSVVKAVATVWYRWLRRGVR